MPATTETDSSRVNSPRINRSRSGLPSGIRVGRLAGIPVRVNFSVLVVAAFVVYTIAFQIIPSIEPDAGTPTSLLAAATCAVLFFVSILGHELGHAVFARRHDVKVEEITLWILGGVAKLVKQAPTPRAEFQIAVGGPLASFMLSALFGIASYTTGTYTDWRLLPVVFAWLGFVNGLLAVSNLLPAAPLDGGRVLTAAIWRRIGDPERARLISGRCGLVLGGGLVVAGAIAITVFDRANLNWASIMIMGLFLIVAAKAEIIGAAIRGRLRSTLVGDLMTAHPPAVADALTVEQLLAQTRPDRMTTAVPVVRWNSTPLGYVLPSHLSSIPDPEQSWTRLETIMHRTETIPRAWSNEPVNQVLERIELVATPIVVVHDPGTLEEVGTLSDPQLDRLMVLPDPWGRLPRLDLGPPPPLRPPLVPATVRVDDRGG